MIIIIIIIIIIISIIIIIIIIMYAILWNIIGDHAKVMCLTKFVVYSHRTAQQ